jgi:hypothetical protein
MENPEVPVFDPKVIGPPEAFIGMVSATATTAVVAIGTSPTNRLHRILSAIGCRADISTWYARFFPSTKLAIGGGFALN